MSGQPEQNKPQQDKNAMTIAASLNWSHFQLDQMLKPTDSRDPMRITAQWNEWRNRIGGSFKRSHHSHANATSKMKLEANENRAIIRDENQMMQKKGVGGCRLQINFLHDSPLYKPRQVEHELYYAICLPYGTDSALYMHGPWVTASAGE